MAILSPSPVEAYFTELVPEWNFDQQSLYLDLYRTVEHDLSVPSSTSAWLEETDAEDLDGDGLVSSEEDLQTRKIADRVIAAVVADLVVHWYQEGGEWTDIKNRHDPLVRRSFDLVPIPPAEFPIDTSDVQHFVRDAVRLVSPSQACSRWEEWWRERVEDIKPQSHPIDEDALATCLRIVKEIHDAVEAERTRERLRRDLTLIAYGAQEVWDGQMVLGTNDLRTFDLPLDVLAIGNIFGDGSNSAQLALLEGGEQCDSEICDACVLPNPTSCGDGAVHIWLGEQCDDGNRFPGDGCDAFCQNEGSYCGDGDVYEGVEQCDDGKQCPDGFACTGLEDCSISGDVCPFDNLADCMGHWQMICKNTGVPCVSDTDCGGEKDACHFAADGVCRIGEYLDPKATPCRVESDCHVLSQCNEDGFCSDQPWKSCGSTGECTSCTAEELTGSCYSTGTWCNNDDDCPSNYCIFDTVAVCKARSVGGVGDAVRDGGARSQCGEFCSVSAHCGDRIVGFNEHGTLEQCDDGMHCADGSACALGQQCRDGSDCKARNAFLPSFRSCDDSCIVQICGDGRVQGGEQCDTGARCVDGTVCDLRKPSVCLDKGICAIPQGDVNPQYCTPSNPLSCPEIPQSGGRRYECLLDKECRARDDDLDGCSAFCQQEYCGDSTLQQRGGEVCDTGGRCAGNGQYCSRHEDCPPYPYCELSPERRCEYDLDCPRGQRCLTSETNESAPYLCLTQDDDGCSTDCTSAESGVSSHSRMCFPVGGWCNSDSDCGAFQPCEARCSVTQERCTEESDCRFTQSCEQGACSDTQDACLSDADCPLVLQTCDSVCELTGEACPLSGRCPSALTQMCDEGTCELTGAPCSDEVDCALVSNACVSYDPEYNQGIAQGGPIPGISCGDGVLNTDEGEECDAGWGNSNTVPGACRTNCTRFRCGDGVVDEGEECDIPTCPDGSLCKSDDDCGIERCGPRSGHEHCSATCTIERCGDGKLQAEYGEQCDDANTISDDGCSSACQVELSLCGNGFLESEYGEECDPAMADETQCTPYCTVAVPLCGDGRRDFGEQCDDGGEDLGCSDDCVLEAPELCGNGVIDAEVGEECDQMHPYHTVECTPYCRFPIPAPFCGDGRVDHAPKDPKALHTLLSSAEGYRLDWRMVAGDYVLPRIFGDRTRETVPLPLAAETVEQEEVELLQQSCSQCGNGIVDAGEECDSGVMSGGYFPRHWANIPRWRRLQYAAERALNDLAQGQRRWVEQMPMGIMVDVSGAHRTLKEDEERQFVLTACSADCTLQLCGNGQLNPGEGCDDGNQESGDGCSERCKSEDKLVLPKNNTSQIFGECGNGKLEPYEWCDDGDLENGDGCNALCEFEYGVCGNGKVEPLGLDGLWLAPGNADNEECDPGSSCKGIDSELCHEFSLKCGRSRACISDPEANQDCIELGGTCVVDEDRYCTKECKKTEFSREQCGDDDVLIWNVDRRCVKVGGEKICPNFEQCDESIEHDGNSDVIPNACRMGCLLPFCGDGVLDRGEECDDANLFPFDGCSFCRVDLCGNGRLDTGEHCDDGNQEEGDGCSQWCTYEGCGNAVKEEGEECDDGGIMSGDGCSENCLLEYCGDGVLQAGLGEECDAGVDNANETDACRITCKLPACGDGILDSRESCEPGSGGPCTEGCVIPCPPGEEDCAQGLCGNGVTDPTEQCDDGKQCTHNPNIFCTHHEDCVSGPCVGSDPQYSIAGTCAGEPYRSCMSAEDCVSRCALLAGDGCATDCSYEQHADRELTLRFCQEELIDFGGGKRASMPIGDAQADHWKQTMFDSDRNAFIKHPVSSRYQQYWYPTWKWWSGASSTQWPWYSWPLSGTWWGERYAFGAWMGYASWYGENAGSAEQIVKQVTRSQCSAATFPNSLGNFIRMTSGCLQYIAQFDPMPRRTSVMPLQPAGVLSYPACQEPRAALATAVEIPPLPTLALKNYSVSELVTQLEMLICAQSGLAHDAFLFRCSAERTPLPYRTSLDLPGVSWQGDKDRAARDQAFAQILALSERAATAPLLAALHDGIAGLTAQIQSAVYLFGDLYRAQFAEQACPLDGSSVCSP